MGVGKNPSKRIGLSGACKRELGAVGHVIVAGATEAWDEAGAAGWAVCLALSIYRWELQPNYRVNLYTMPPPVFSAVFLSINFKAHF